MYVYAEKQAGTIDSIFWYRHSTPQSVCRRVPGSLWSPKSPVRGLGSLRVWALGLEVELGNHHIVTCLGISISKPRPKFQGLACNDCMPSHYSSINGRCEAFVRPEGTGLMAQQTAVDHTDCRPCIFLALFCKSAVVIFRVSGLGVWCFHHFVGFAVRFVLRGSSGSFHCLQLSLLRFYAMGWMLVLAM